ncbi:MAG: hypothetical protein J5701_03100 [Bacteroidales bacterium]|nr:hypothetical protein [Bacteroidales bacterium]
MFPIHTLNSNITNILQKILSANILGNIQNGLQPEIKFIDECSHISNVAEIKGNSHNAQVYLSSAYCQFLWLLDDIALKLIDFSIIQDECIKNNIEVVTYKKSTEYLIQNPEILNVLANRYGIDFNQYFEYLRRTVQLLERDEFERNIKKEWALAESLINSSRTICINDFNEIDFNGLYEQLVNSVYCFGVSFILLHELTHFAMGHLEKEEEMQDEENADFSAFWNLYNDLKDRELFSANIGILCALFSLLMLNPNMEEDEIHPKESDRIFYIFDQISEDNPKYSVLIIKLFAMWAEKFNIQEFPDINGYASESLKLIRDFMNNYKF